MEAFILALLSAPQVRALITETAVSVVASILHRRAVDPEYLAQSDVIFSRLTGAKTDEEKNAALADIQRLMSS